MADQIFFRSDSEDCVNTRRQIERWRLLNDSLLLETPSKRDMKDVPRAVLRFKIKKIIFSQDYKG